MRNHKLFVTTSATDSAAPATEGIAVTGANTYYSKMFSGNETYGGHLHVEYSGTPTGTLTLWYSSKPNPVETTDTDWVQDAGWAPTNPAGAAGKFGTDIVDKQALRKRIKYVNTAGSGTLKAWVTSSNS